MAPSCVVDPMDCIYQNRLPFSHYKRAPPSDDSGPAPPDNKTVVVATAVGGSLVLILSLALFFCCVRKRRASRRIGQLQRFLPTFMDQEKTEKYFQRHSSSSTLVAAPAPKDLSPPSNVHHRTRSAPIAFEKGAGDHRSRTLEREESLGQFQQISLTSDEPINEKEELGPRQSLSGRSTRSRSATVVAPAAQVKSSLHRSVSLNKHSNQGTINSRNAPIGVEEDEDEESGHPNKFAEGESLVAPNRFSAFLDFSQSNNNNRFSATSIIDFDPNFDPSRFSSASIMFDAKRSSNLSNASSDDNVSISSSDEFRNNLPPHQEQPSFHSHHNSPTMRGQDVDTEVPIQTLSHQNQSQPMYFGDKQELDEDEEIIPQPMARYTGVRNYPRQEFYPPMQQNSSMSVPMHMPMPMPVPFVSTSPALPPRIKLPRPHSGQEMSFSVADAEVKGDRSHY
ncbi:hypothetical protein BC939DRAFT_461973 [Gamsiella multidivaricata]|uniref:uncharacterized protein n=1 Tax=Gamsiella multidivaricata TaxID=101098 RepID=UPI00221EBE14|nr:uncharacterized protein BC939DRAFT_461973 [Gamsiella multidivaricata]KAG0358210.1 hypothetical protein BGZ54_010534 [Gamsiella multidivaricata]KAI7818775.1 hypothetical protein BC939DRAFT_461973 [Gamsiella multidivaricata]